MPVSPQKVMPTYALGTEGVGLILLGNCRIEISDNAGHGDHVEYALATSKEVDQSVVVCDH